MPQCVSYFAPVARKGTRCLPCQLERIHGTVEVSEDEA